MPCCWRIPAHVCWASSRTNDTNFTVGSSLASRARSGSETDVLGPPPLSSVKKFLLKTKLRISRMIIPPMPICIPPKPNPPPPPPSSRRSSMSSLVPPGVHRMLCSLDEFSPSYTFQRNFFNHKGHEGTTKERFLLYFLFRHKLEQ